MFRLALVQMTVDGGDPDANIARALDRIGVAADRGAHVALLPEALDLGWTHPCAARLAEPIPGGARYGAIAAAARDHGIHVCAGLVEREGDLCHLDPCHLDGRGGDRRHGDRRHGDRRRGDRVYNSAVLIGADGSLLLKHRKLNELEIGHDAYAQGDRLGVCETPFGTIGVMICADAFARDLVLTRALGYMGADVILSPCAWAVPPDHDNDRDPYGGLWRESYMPVARAFETWIAGVSNVGPVVAGPWNGWNCIGCSLVIDPDGGERVHGPYGRDADELIIVEIEPRPRPARGCDWMRYWNETGRADG